MRNILVSCMVLAVLAAPVQVVFADDLTATIKMLEQTEARLHKVLQEVKRKGQHLPAEKKRELKKKTDAIERNVLSYEEWTDTYLTE